MKRITPKSLDELLKMLPMEGISLVEFSASWCGPCKHMAGALEELTKRPIYKEVNFFGIDVDDCNELSEYLEISAIPTFYVYKGRTKFQECTGANIDRVVELLNSSLDVKAE